MVPNVVVRQTEHTDTILVYSLTSHKSSQFWNHYRWAVQLPIPTHRSDENAC
jgi:hypothetical protein